jgi:hypothetical protein
MRLYQLATVLMALLNTEQQDPRFLAVREHFERNVFPTSPEQGAELLAEVKKAMRHLNDLIDLINPEKQQGAEGKAMLWAHAWLQDIGVNATNPVTFFLFAHYWMTYYTMVHKYLRMFNPSA